MALPSVASLALPRPELPKAVLTRPRRLAASPPPEGWLVLYPPPLRWEPVYTRVCMRVTLHPRHAPPGARQGPRRLGCASSPPLELGRRPSRAGRLASGAVRVRCGPLSSVPARHGVRASRCTHATPTWRPPRPWPLFAEPHYCGTDVAEKGSAAGAPAAGPLGGPALRLRACDADGLAGFA